MLVTLEHLKEAESWYDEGWGWQKDLGWNDRHREAIKLLRQLIEHGSPVHYCSSTAFYFPGGYFGKVEDLIAVEHWDDWDKGEHGMLVDLAKEINEVLLEVVE
jgi:hypothetical protein